ncbi:M23 family metallopeptidase [Tuberibacillus sp. Marseille-P3662]|uniref:M23 family metallopeptidase n=1 Tax=Tuberibacillus sp. Marseille-P3662 TaxID=1965358 RepID=UPI000A1C8A72|nr:M23 family metallopeptidase [Tuberibacillus sp. Marseille-P3662]
MKQMTLIFVFALSLMYPAHLGLAKEDNTASQKEKRKSLYLKTAAVSNIPWYYLAAIDQYERNIRSAQKELPDPNGLSGILIPDIKWFGLTNPNHKKTDAKLINLMDGFGQDGNGDGKADPDNPEDVLYSMAVYLNNYGPNRDNIKIALWKYYQSGKAVDIITQIAKVYQTFNTIQLSNHDFPIPLKYNFDYDSTWGARRGYGGLRIHEGTDIFADYGTPVKATSYGTIELIGWNRFGGWRVGIRDTQNNYHYFAHLKGYADGIKKGSVVKPGQVIGYVGSSGYGPEGTQGKFPPHLHYGMYRYNGKTDYSFDPYPYLRQWQQQAKQEK